MTEEQQKLKYVFIPPYDKPSKICLQESEMSEKLLNRPCEGQSWKILADFGFKNPKFCQKRKFGQKLKICSNLENFGKKWKIENYVFEDHRKFGKKFSKIEILVKVENFVKNRIFGQKSKIWSKVENFVKKRNFVQKSKIWSNIENFGEKIENLVKNRKF